MFTADDLARMRASQTGHMQDLCIIQVYTRTFNSFGEPVVTYVDALSSTVCGLDMRPGAERHNQQNTALEYDATIRLPIETSMDARNRIKVTQRFGEDLTTPLVFEVVGSVQRGPSGIRLMLRRVEV